jgi:hypothetical protein
LGAGFAADCDSLLLDVVVGLEEHPANIRRAMQATTNFLMNPRRAAIGIWQSALGLSNKRLVTSD